MTRMRWTLIALPLLLIGADGPRESEAVKKEWERLNGTWQLVSEESDGKTTPEDRVKGRRYGFNNGWQTVFHDDRKVPEANMIKIDPSASPASMDITHPGGQIKAIYELDGDTLKICMANRPAPRRDALPTSRPRPKKFTGKAGSGQTLRLFKRVKT
jgi:uncharacterized protein (TIGR03067 family)